MITSDEAHHIATEVIGPCGLDVHGRHVRLAGDEYIAFAEYAQRTGGR